MSVEYKVVNLTNFRDDRVTITTIVHEGRPHMALGWPDPESETERWFFTLLDEYDLRSVLEHGPGWLEEWGAGD